MELMRFDLNSELTFEYFVKSITSKNTLSKSISKWLDLRKQGSFFTLLPSDINTQKIYQFSFGGITKSLQEETAKFLLERLLSRKTASLVFDDVLENSESISDYAFFLSNGFSFNSEVYYEVRSKKKPNLNAILEGIRASDTIWHCLGVLTTANINSLRKKNCSICELEQIAMQADLIMTTAYDGEGYIFWEATQNMSFDDSEQQSLKTWE